MTVRAEYDPTYFRRFLWMALACAGASAWFFFDGSVTYPNELKRCEAYWQATDNPNDPWKPMESRDWVKVAASNDWSKEIPRETPDKQREKIGTQFFYAIGSLIIAIPCLLKWFLARGTWVEGDEKSIRTSWGQELKFEQVETLNKRKWKDKGIAKVKYLDEGQPVTFVLDDFKYHRESMDTIIRSLEATLTDEQILNGKRQPPKKAATDAEKEVESVAAGDTDNAKDQNPTESAQ